VKVLIFGDIYGRMGRKAFSKEFERLCDTYQPDFTVVNIENITSGRGPISEHAEFIANHGVDVMTAGDHSFDNSPNIDKYFASSGCKLIRPANFYEGGGIILP